MCESHLQEKELDSRQVIDSMLALCRIFSRIMGEDSNFLEVKKDKSSAEAKKTDKNSKDIFVDWMSANYKRFTKLLLQAIQKKDPTLQAGSFTPDGMILRELTIPVVQIAAMRAVMGLVAREVEERSKEPMSTFANGLFKSLLMTILRSPNSSPELLEVVCTKAGRLAQYLTRPSFSGPAGELHRRVCRRPLLRIPDNRVLHQHRDSQRRRRQAAAPSRSTTFFLTHPSAIVSRATRRAAAAP